MILESLKLGATLIVGTLGIFIVFGFIIGRLEKLNSIYIRRAFGQIGIFITSCIGTPVHEFGHYIMCKLFLHQVVEVRWFRPIESKNDYVLGYVKHKYNANSIYQRIGTFFIGTAPLFVGSLIIILFSMLLLPETYSALKGIDGITFKKVIVTIFSFENLRSWKFWLFLFLSASISSHMDLSRADIEGSIVGFITLVCLVFLFSFAVNILGINIDNIFEYIKKYNIVFGIILSVGVVSSILTLIVSFSLSIFRK